MKSNAGSNLRPERAGEPTIKTLSDWIGNFDESFFPGDRVSEEVALYFGEVVAPITAGMDLIQCGEPTDIVNGRFTYSTFFNDRISWIYCGNCHEGEKEEPEDKDHGE